MSARKSYSMSQEQYDAPIAAMQSGPLIALQCGTGMSHPGQYTRTRNGSIRKIVAVKSK